MHVAVAALIAFALLAAEAGAQNVPRKQATPIFRLGGPDAAQPYAFSERPSLIVDADSVIYARLSSEGTVLVFRPDGSFLRRIGREGQGPGEFQLAQAHGFIGDTLWVRNWPTPRISLFAKDGSHIATRQTPFDIGRPLSAPGSISGFLTGGRAFVTTTALVLGDDGPTQLPMLIGSREMKNIDTVAMMPSSRGLDVPKVGAWSFAPMPVSPLLAISAAGTAIATAQWDRAKPETVTLRVVAPDGSERLRRQLQLSSRPMPKAVRDSLLAVALSKARPQIEAARRRGIALGASNERLVEEGLDLPSHYPPVRTLVLGIDGTVWLERFGEGRTGDWLVLDSRGEPLFEIRLPATLEVQQASATDVWGTDRDELDVSYMVRMRLSLVR